MTPLYSELLSLIAAPDTPVSNPDGAKSAILTAALPDLPEQLRREMETKTARFIMPEKPDGMEFNRDSFGRKYQQN